MLSSLAALVLLFPAQQPATGASTRATGETPAQEFLRIGRELYEGDCPQYGAEPAATIEKLLAHDKLEGAKRIQGLIDLGHEWVELGKIEPAIERLEEALRRAEAEDRPKQVNRVQRELALAYLRLAENQNCVERHAAACCILPLRDGALHTLREPAKRARELYLTIVERSPDDLASRWVLNLLCMLLGEYPDGVPEAYRIPMRAFAPQISSDETPLFRDVAAKAGIVGLNLAGGAAAEDFDGDGWIDILSSTCDPLGSLLYYHNNGDGTFEDRSDLAHTSEQLGGLNLITGDYDNDGDQDALVLRGGWLLDYGCVRKSLLRNDDGKSFVDVTRAAGVADPAFPTMAAAFADFDSDGWLDLYVGHESRIEIEDGKGNYPSVLFMSNGDGTFHDGTRAAGVSNERYAKGVAAGDYDDDGDIDLFVSNIGKKRLYQNDGKARFQDVAEHAGVDDAPHGRSFATWFFDYDNDGHLDLWVSGYLTSIVDLASEALFQPDHGVRPCLYHNSGDGTFKDVAKEVGLDRPIAPMGANFGDIDNDGWLDFYLGTGDPLLQSLMPNLMFRNAGGERFEDITAKSGLGHLQKGHGVAFADFDHDGDQDMFHQLGGFVPVDKFQDVLFENTAQGGHWLSLELEGTRTNRMAVGARLHLVLDTPEGSRDLYRAAGSVSSFGCSTHRQEIGLGDATRIARLEIRWPRSEKVQVFENVPIDAWLHVREGESSFQRIERQTFHF